MELNIASHKNVPEGSIVSIRSGHIRRQAPVNSGRAYRFPAYGTSMRVDIFQPMAVGHLIIRPTSASGEDTYNVVFEDDVDMECEVKVQPVKELEIGFDRSMTTSPQIMPAPPDGPPSGRPTPASRDMSSINSEQDYIDKHGILEFVKTVLQTIISDKPDDPYAVLSSLFRNESYSKKENEPSDKFSETMKDAEAEPPGVHIPEPSEVPAQPKKAPQSTQRAVIGTPSMPRTEANARPSFPNRVVTRSASIDLSAEQDQEIQDTAKKEMNTGAHQHRNSHQEDTVNKTQEQEQQCQTEAKDQQRQRDATVQEGPADQAMNDSFVSDPDEDMLEDVPSLAQNLMLMEKEVEKEEEKEGGVKKHIASILLSSFRSGGVFPEKQAKSQVAPFPFQPVQGKKQQHKPEDGLFPSLINKSKEAKEQEGGVRRQVASELLEMFKSGCLSGVIDDLLGSLVIENRQTADVRDV